MHPSSVNHERFASAAESGRQVRRRRVRVRGGGVFFLFLFTYTSRVAADPALIVASEGVRVVPR